MTNAADTILKDVVDTLHDSVGNLNVDKFAVAQDLHWAHEVITWSMTKYKSWSGFCEQEVKMGISSIYRYTTVVSLCKKFGYTNAECHRMILSLGWTRFANCLLLLKKKMAVKSFITKFKDYSTIYGATCTPSNDFGTDRAYAFSLPHELADKLDGYLTHYGMSTAAKNKRRGVRDAFIKLVKIQLD
jgi:hypothetical protein